MLTTIKIAKEIGISHRNVKRMARKVPLKFKEVHGKGYYLTRKEVFLMLTKPNNWPLVDYVIPHDDVFIIADKRRILTLKGRRATDRRTTPDGMFRNRCVQCEFQ